MSVLNPVSTTEIIPRRPGEDAHGNKVFTNLPAVSVVFALGPPARAAWRAHGERYVQDGQVFVPRGTDLLGGDEVPYGDPPSPSNPNGKGRWFTIVGDARGDQDQPFTGDDFGWVVFTLAGGG